MIEGIRLPHGRIDIESVGNLATGNRLPSFEPCGAWFRALCRHGEEMEVVGHDHVAPDEPAIAIGGTGPERGQNFHCSAAGQDCTPLRCASGEEIQRRAMKRDEVREMHPRSGWQRGVRPPAYILKREKRPNLSHHRRLRLPELGDCGHDAFAGDLVALLAGARIVVIGGAERASEDDRDGRAKPDAAMTAESFV